MTDAPPDPAGLPGPDPEKPDELDAVRQPKDPPLDPLRPGDDEGAQGDTDLPDDVLDTADRDTAVPSVSETVGGS